MLSALILCSCASTPPEPLTHWRDYELADIETTPPVAVPAQPQAEVIETGGRGLVCYTPEGAAQLAARIEALGANSKAGEEFRLALVAQAKAGNSLVETARITEQYTNHLQNELHKATEEQARDKNRHLLERVFLQLLLLGSFL